MEEIVSLVIPFITLSILSVMVDKLTLFLQEIMHHIPKLPDRFEYVFAFITIFVTGYFICWQLDFALFRYFGLDAKIIHLDYILTALLISGGSSFLRVNFSQIESIPSVLQGVSSAFKNMTFNTKNNYNNQSTYQNTNENIPYDLLDLDENYNKRKENE